MENLNEMGLVELDNRTIQKIDGGIWGALAIGLVGAAIYDCISNHEAFVDGFNRGFNG